MASQREWPRVREENGTERTSPVGHYLAPDAIERSDRSLAGPLRLGTSPGVGPRGRAVLADYEQRSDMGTDRITPRDFDPMGTARRRFGSLPSDLVSREIRGSRSSRRDNG